MKKSRRRSLFVAGGKEMGLRSSLQLASKMRPYVLSTKQGGDGFLKCVGEENGREEK